MIKKKKKEIKLHPALLFLALTVVVMIVSSVCSILNIETSYYSVNPVTGDLESVAVTIDSLFNRTGIQYLISNMLSNFINFAPLGTIIVGLLGIGVAYKSGFLTAVCKIIEKSIPHKLITFIIILFGILSSMFLESGYVIIIPLAAILFMKIGRHPSAGICAAFAGVTFGYGANFFVNGLDSSLVTYTRSATKILDTSYTVGLSGNIYFMIISSILIALVGTVITEKYIIPRLGKYVPSLEEEEPKEITEKERKGLILSLTTFIIMSLVIIYCIIPGLPFSGLFLDLKANTYVDQLFGDSSYFNQGIVVIESFMLMVTGLIYGLRVKTIKNNRDFVDGMNYYLSELTSILVLIFFAAQLCFIFKKSNLGVFITASLTEILGKLPLTGIFLVIISFLFIIICDIFLPVASTKWAIMSPVLVPMFMQSSLAPELAQAVFRAADSSIKGITPLFTYFVILIGFLQIYNQNKKESVTLTDAIALITPYTIAFTVLWLLIILGFYLIGIPLGPGVSAVL